MNFKDLALVFGSRTKAQEILYLFHDLKNVVRQGFYPEELTKVERFCRDHGLYLVQSRFKVLLDDEPYSNKGMRIMDNDPRRGMYFVYISKDEQEAWLAHYYELMGNNHDFGLILGYPSCCVKFFCRNFSETTTNLEHPPQNMFTNLSKRDQDCVLLSHFPCSPVCERSMAMGKQYLDLLMELDRERAEEMVDLLRRK